MKKPAGALFVLAIVWFVACALRSARADDGLAFFESKIRPLLAAHCISCHGGSEPKGGLSLESRAGWQEAGVIEPRRSGGKACLSPPCATPMKTSQCRRRRLAAN